MKKIISLLVIALLSITTISSVNARGSSATIENLLVNWKQIASWYQILIQGGTWSTIYYEIRSNENNDGTLTSKNYKYNAGNITEVKATETSQNTIWNKENLTISKHYKLEKDNNDADLTNVYVDGKLDWSYYSAFSYGITEVSNNIFYYTPNSDNWELNHKVFIFEDKKVETTPIQETPKTIKANTQLDKALKPFFEKTDKKWDEVAQKTYKTLISKIDILLKKRLSVKNKNTLNYLKEKVQEKIK